MTDKAEEEVPPPERPRSSVYPRESLEFGRALSFFDATFAVALTLLVTTLGHASRPQAWNSVETLISADGAQLIAFFLSFAVVSRYWLASHQFGASLVRLSTRLIVGTLVLLAGVVILPFSTEALGAFHQPLATAVYAVNVAFISSIEAVLFILAWTEGLLETVPARRTALVNLVPQVLPPVVFLLSVPLAYLWSSAVARLSWLSLLLLMPPVTAWAKRSAKRGSDSSEGASSPT